MVCVLNWQLGDIICCYYKLHKSCVRTATLSNGCNIIFSGKPTKKTYGASSRSVIIHTSLSLLAQRLGWGRVGVEHLRGLLYLLVNILTLCNRRTKHVTETENLTDWSEVGHKYSNCYNLKGNAHKTMISWITVRIGLLVPPIRWHQANGQRDDGRISETMKPQYWEWQEIWKGSYYENRHHLW